MNKDFEAAEELTTAIQEAIENINLKTEVVLCPPFPYLELVTDMADESNFNAGAQNCSQFNDGAYTGEVSASMLAGMGVTFCIVGHSERRKYFHETSEVIAEKVNRLIEQEIIPVFCCGEVLAKFLDVPCYAFSHQQGHVAAAAWSGGRSDLLDEPHLAWHLSPSSYPPQAYMPAHH